MRVGKYRNRIKILKLEKTQDSSGNIIEDWVEHKKVWAKIFNLQGRQYWEAKQAQSEVTGEIRIRYTDDLTTDMRIKHGEKEYDIESLFDADARRRELVIMVKER